MTALREGVTASRVSDFYNNKMNLRKQSGNISIIDTGEQTTVCGSGELFNKFLQTGVIDNFSGFGTKPVTFFKCNFSSAPYRVITYDQTFRGLPYDCTKGNYFQVYISIFTGRVAKRAKVKISQASVTSTAEEGGATPMVNHPPPQDQVRHQPPPRTWSENLPPPPSRSPPRDYTQAGVTHPTGMHSCLTEQSLEYSSLLTC